MIYSGKLRAFRNATLTSSATESILSILSMPPVVTVTQKDSIWVEDRGETEKVFIYLFIGARDRKVIESSP